MPKTITKKLKKEEKEPKVVKKVVKKAVKPKIVKKPVVKKPVIKEIEKEKPVRYIESIGRRKTATARVRLWTKGDKTFLVNNKSHKEYFPIFEHQKNITDPLEKMKLIDKFRVEARVKGGGLTAQSEAIRHGISKALVEVNQNFRKRLKKAGFLTRDPRMRERKKFGLKRARRAPQWKKR